MREEMLSQDSDPEMVDSGGSVRRRSSGGTIPGSRKFLFSYKFIFMSLSMSSSLSASNDRRWLLLDCKQFNWFSCCNSRCRFRFLLNVCRIRKNHIDIVLMYQLATITESREQQLGTKWPDCIKKLLMTDFFLEITTCYNDVKNLSPRMTMTTMTVNVLSMTWTLFTEVSK